MKLLEYYCNRLRDFYKNTDKENQVAAETSVVVSFIKGRNPPENVQEQHGGDKIVRIAILGAGAMGILIGGFLSSANDVTLIDVNPTVVEKIQNDGVVIQEKNGTSCKRYPNAVVDTSGMKPVDLMIVFVKAMYSEQAIETNRALIGPDTYLMTLQNGAGHEETLLKFVDEEHVVIGTTQHNSSVLSLGKVFHGGTGHTYIGGLKPYVDQLKPICDAFNASGLEASLDTNVKRLIWSKLFTNVSASALTGVLQCQLGFIAENTHARTMCETLIDEAVQVAESEQMEFNAEQELDTVLQVCRNAPNGYTSIYADITAGRRSEVDTISGSIVKAGHAEGVPTPVHAFLVEMVHAMEDLQQQKKTEV